MAFFITNQKENLYISQENFSKQAIGHGINNNVTDDHSIDTLTSIVIDHFAVHLLPILPREKGGPRRMLLRRLRGC
jgi:hypothetical protein